MARFTIIDGHPDAQPHLTHALADAYETHARMLGHDVHRVTLATLDLTFLRSPEEFLHGRPPEAAARVQEAIAGCDHVALFFPLWMGDAPAMLKALIEHVFRPGFAMTYGASGGFPKPLLTGKSARVVVTMGMPAMVYRAMGATSLRTLRRNLAMVGFGPIHDTLIGGAFELAPARVETLLNELRTLAEHDGERPHARLPRAALALAGVAAAGGAYAAAAVTAWLRYGRTAGEDSLLAEVLPTYDLALRYHTIVEAPAAVTFDAMRTTELERSPIVRALFRLREVVLRAQHAEFSLPNGLVERIAALGWTLVAESPGRELVFASVTRPWRPDADFRGLPRDEFVRFNEPGYAKIAFTLRIDERGADRCEARTETRVLTTDAKSRARFRRYWALAAPGIELIRIVLLQQIKSEAESRRTETLRAVADPAIQ